MGKTQHMDILPVGCVQFVTDPGLSQHLLWLRSRPSTGKLGKIGKILGEIGKINCFHKNAFQMNNEQNTKNGFNVFRLVTIEKKMPSVASIFCWSFCS